MEKLPSLIHGKPITDYSG